MGCWKIQRKGRRHHRKISDGRSRVRFKDSCGAADTPACMKELVELYDDANKERIIPPLLLLAAFNLDFLCIHPFRDGNGRVSRLLSTPAMLPSGVRGGPIHQPGTPHRAEQGTLLRNPGAKLPRLARGKPRSLAIHQLHSFSSSRPPTGNSRNASVNCKVLKERKPALCFKLSVGLLALSVLPRFRMNARMSAWT